MKFRFYYIKDEYDCKMKYYKNIEANNFEEARREFYKVLQRKNYNLLKIKIVKIEKIINENGVNKIYEMKGVIING